MTTRVKIELDVEVDAGSTYTNGRRLAEIVLVGGIRLGTGVYVEFDTGDCVKGAIAAITVGDATR